MTAPLRRAHLAIWTALAVMLVALLVSGLAARRRTTPVHMGIDWKQLR